ncbi:MAG: hypothetical protein PVF15_03485 [Candidatus Bathyarchaeota archaeon]|jgi:hypothetical protein
MDERRIKQLEKQIEDLEQQLAALKAPPAPEKDMIPIDVDEKRNLVLARRYVGSKIELHIRKAEGGWKPVFEYLLARKRIDDKIESLASQLPDAVEIVPAEDVDEDD